MSHGRTLWLRGRGAHEALGRQDPSRGAAIGAGVKKRALKASIERLNAAVIRAANLWLGADKKMSALAERCGLRYGRMVEVMCGGGSSLPATVKAADALAVDVPDSIRVRLMATPSATEPRSMT